MFKKKNNVKFILNRYKHTRLQLSLLSAKTEMNLIIIKYDPKKLVYKLCWSILDIGAGEVLWGGLYSTRALKGHGPKIEHSCSAVERLPRTLTS